MSLLQAGIFPVNSDDHPRVMKVGEASVRATHHFVSEADIDSTGKLYPLLHMRLHERITS